MKHLLLPVLIAAGAAAAAPAQQCLDQNAPTNNACMAGFGSVDLAQSFKQAAPNINGAGIFMHAGVGAPETLTISLWDRLPNAGGALLASGSGTAVPGAWFNVSWNCVTIAPGATYYLLFSTTASMCYDGDVNNGYPHGNLFANPGFVSFPTFDYTFRTYNCCGGGGPSLTKLGSCPGPMRLDLANCTPNGPVAIFFGAAGSFTKNGPPCNGLVLGIQNPVLAGVLNVNASGGASYPVNLPASACGRTVQAVDALTCTPTNPLVL